MKKMNNQKQQGFTLIELVIVIVILGVLAATAAPKFINLTGDAKGATLQAVKGSIETAMAGVYAKALIKGVNNSSSSTVTVNGSTVYTVYGYPRGYSTDMANLLDIDANKFSIKNSGGAGSRTYYVYIKGNTAPTATTDNCIVAYTEATSATTRPTVVFNSGC